MTNIRKEVDTMTKMTYVSVINDVLNGTELTPEHIDKLTALKASLEKRGTAVRKPSKTQVANEGVKTDILGVLTNEGQKCGDIAKALEISSQKCSALLAQLVKSGEVEKFSEKRATLFRLAQGE